MKNRFQLLLFSLTGALLLTACWGDDPGDITPCFTFDGERVCEEIGEDFSIFLPFDPAEAQGWIVRFHPEDADRWGFPETIPVLSDERTEATSALVERSIVSPSHVCVDHNVYVQDLVAGRQMLIFEAGNCGVRSLPLLSDKEWEPIRN